MWASFALSCLAVAVLLYLPGCLAFGRHVLERKILIAWAPFVSLLLICIIGFLAYTANFAVSGWFLIAASVVVGALIGLAGFLACRCKNSQLNKNDSVSSIAGDSFGILCLYLCAGLAVSLYAFASVIGSPDWFSVEIDNAYHLNELNAMASTGQFSAFSISTFPTVQGFGSSGDSSFYPALWHVVAAVALDSVASSAPIAENATNFVFVAMVFPLGVWSFLASAFKGNKNVVVAGSLTCVCFFDFPWRLLTYGLLCSNLAAFAMVPAALSIFVLLVDVGTVRTKRLALVVVLLVAVFCLALLQPNAIFSCIVLAAPYCIWRILYSDSLFGFSAGRAHRSLIAIAFIGICVLTWLLAYNIPFMQEVLSVSWDHFSSKTQGVFNILFLSYCGGPANPIMAFLVIIGIASALRDKRLRWVVLSYGLCAIIHYSTASTESVLKHWFSGFWYTDPHRTAALCVLAAIPLSAIGLVSVVNFCEGAARLLKRNDLLPEGHGKTSMTVSLVVAVLLLLPNFDFNGVGAVNTTFGKVRELTKSQYDMEDGQTLSAEEVAFVKESKRIVGDDLVLNSPFDGTAFLYGVTGVQFYYRSLLSSPDSNPNEPSESRVLRHSLASYKDNEEARLALGRTNAKYVLLLDSSQRDDRKHVFTYHTEDWMGIDSVSESTEGFDLVLSEGDMKLYKITDA